MLMFDNVSASARMNHVVAEIKVKDLLCNVFREGRSETTLSMNIRCVLENEEH